MITATVLIHHTLLSYTGNTLLRLRSTLVKPSHVILTEYKQFDFLRYRGSVGSVHRDVLSSSRPILISVKNGRRRLRLASWTAAPPTYVHLPSVISGAPIYRRQSRLVLSTLCGPNKNTRRSATGSRRGSLRYLTFSRRGTTRQTVQPSSPALHRATNVFRKLVHNQSYQRRVYLPTTEEYLCSFLKHGTS